jgi:hypothetical protein
MPFCIHALDEGIVVTTLGSVSGTLCSARASHAPEHQPGASTHASARLPTDGGTRNRTDDSADSSATHTRINARPVGSTRLLLGVLATVGVVVAKLLKTLSAARQGHDAGACWRSDTADKQQQRGDGKRHTNR